MILSSTKIFFTKNYCEESFTGLTIEQAIKKIKKEHKLELHEDFFFESLHEVWELNLCDYCGVIEKSTLLKWNDLGAICLDCYDGMSKKEQEAWEEDV